MFRHQGLLRGHVSGHYRQARLHRRPRGERDMDLPDPRADGQGIPRLLAEGHQQYQPEFRIIERSEEASVGLPQSRDLGHAGRVRDMIRVHAWSRMRVRQRLVINGKGRGWCGGNVARSRAGALCILKF